MSNAACIVAVIGILAVSGRAADVSDRGIVSAPTVAAGAVNAASTFTAASTSNSVPPKALTFTWNFGDGSPTVTNSAATTTHIYIRPFTYVATLTVVEAGNPTPTVKTLNVAVTDAISSTRFLSTFNFSKPGKDFAFWTGTMKLPTGDALKSKEVRIDIGGMLLGFTMDDKFQAKFTTNANVVSGISTNSNLDGFFKLYIRHRATGIQYSTARFMLRLRNATLLPAWGDEFVFNRDADKEPIKLSSAISFLGISTNSNLGVTSNGNGTSKYTTTLSANLISKKDGKGKLR